MIGKASHQVKWWCQTWRVPSTGWGASRGGVPHGRGHRSRVDLAGGQRGNPRDGWNRRQRSLATAMHALLGEGRGEQEWARRVRRAGTTDEGEKNITFFWQKRSSNCDFAVVPPFCPPLTWWVGPVWGVRRAQIEWELFSIVFAPYCTEMCIFALLVFGRTRLYEFIYLYLYYKERRQLKIFLTQIVSVLHLTPDPPVIYF
jgi:hypothetical protein